MKFTTGDIITTTIKGNPFFYHKGVIVVKEGSVLVIHNTPSRKNPFGGNVVTETLADFLASGRTILKRKPTDLTHQHILSAVDSVKHLPFDKLKFNCEDFIYYVRTGKKHKPRLLTLNSIFSLPRSITTRARKIDNIK